MQRNENIAKRSRTEPDSSTVDGTRNSTLAVPDSHHKGQRRYTKYCRHDCCTRRDAEGRLVGMRSDNIQKHERSRTFHPPEHCKSCQCSMAYIWDARPDAHSSSSALSIVDAESVPSSCSATAMRSKNVAVPTFAALVPTTVKDLPSGVPFVFGEQIDSAMRERGYVLFTIPPHHNPLVASPPTSVAASGLPLVDFSHLFTRRVTFYPLRLTLINRTLTDTCMRDSIHNMYTGEVPL